MYSNLIIDYSFRIIGLIVSGLSCFYTFKTYKKSHDILDIVKAEGRYRWNKNELEKLFSKLPIDSIDSLFANPTIIRDDLWRGLRAVDLNMFQFDGEEKIIIVEFVERLDELCLLRYEQTPSKQWKFEPLSAVEAYNNEKELSKYNELMTKVKLLKPLYDKVKNVLLRYHIDFNEVNTKARDFYSNIKEEEEM